MVTTRTRMLSPLEPRHICPIHCTLYLWNPGASAPFIITTTTIPSGASVHLPHSQPRYFHNAIGRACALYAYATGSMAALFAYATGSMARCMHTPQGAWRAVCIRHREHGALYAYATGSMAALFAYATGSMARCAVCT
jgi:hypothetical protein